MAAGHRVRGLVRAAQKTDTLAKIVVAPVLGDLDEAVVRCNEGGAAPSSAHGGQPTATSNRYCRCARIT
jgi:hypothetical protein